MHVLIMHTHMCASGYFSCNSNYCVVKILYKNVIVMQRSTFYKQLENATFNSWQ